MTGHTSMLTDQAVANTWHDLILKPPPATWQQHPTVQRNCRAARIATATKIQISTNFEGHRSVRVVIACMCKLSPPSPTLR